MVQYTGKSTVTDKTQEYAKKMKRKQEERGSLWMEERVAQGIMRQTEKGQRTRKKRKNNMRKKIKTLATDKERTLSMHDSVFRYNETNFHT